MKQVYPVAPPGTAVSACGALGAGEPPLSVHHFAWSPASGVGPIIGRRERNVSGIGFTQRVYLFTQVSSSTRSAGPAAG